MNLWSLRVNKNRKRLKVEALKQWAEIMPEDSVLELGGGLMPIKETAVNVSIENGLDFDSFETIDKFDFVVCADALYFSKNPLGLLKKARDWMKPHGKLVLSVMPPTDFMRERVDKRARFLYWWDAQALRCLLEEAGYKNIKFTGFGFNALHLPIFLNSELDACKCLFAVAEC